MELEYDLILPIGISGSGKSTWVRTLPKEYAVVSPDDIRRELTGKVSSQGCNDEVFQIVYSELDRILWDGGRAVLDATNLNTVQRRTLLDHLAERHPGIRIGYKLFPLDVDESHERILKDVAAGVDRAYVPYEGLARQALMYGRAIEDIREEPMEEIGE